MSSNTKSIEQETRLENSSPSEEVMMESQELIPTLSDVSVNLEKAELMNLMEKQELLLERNRVLSARVDKLLNKYRTEPMVKKDGLDIIMKKAWGVVKKTGALYKCLIGEDGKIVKGSYRNKPGKVLEDIAVEVSGVKNGRKWLSWKRNKGGDFVRGTFKWLSDL